MAEFQNVMGKLSVILAECLILLFQFMVISYVDSSCGISFLWFKRVLEGEQYGVVVPWLKSKKSVRGRARIRQSAEEWRSLLGGTKSVCA